MMNICEIRDELEILLKENGIEVDKNIEIELDSLTFVSLIISIEEKFGIEIPDSAFFQNIKNLEILSGILSNCIELRGKN